MMGFEQGQKWVKSLLNKLLQATHKSIEGKPSDDALHLINFLTDIWRIPGMSVPPQKPKKGETSTAQN